MEWFRKWNTGDFLDLPLSEDFTHTSPFGVVEGKQAYMELIQQNKEKFLGYTFTIHDALYEDHRGCIRYTAQQGDDFSLEVSEWHYVKDGLIQAIIAHYHIGDIREERKYADS